MIAFGVLFSGLVGLGCGGRMSGSSDNDSFSPLVGGLRGRLIATAAGAGPISVDLELENLSTQPLRVALGDPAALAATVTDAAGQVVPPAGSATVAQLAQPAIEIPPAARRRQTVSTTHDGANLALGASFWNLAAGQRYQVLATWTSSAEGGWAGTLQLPAITINLP